MINLGDSIARNTWFSLPEKLSKLPLQECPSLESGENYFFSRGIVGIYMLLKHKASSYNQYIVKWNNKRVILRLK